MGRKSNRHEARAGGASNYRWTGFFGGGIADPRVRFRGRTVVFYGLCCFAFVFGIAVIYGLVAWLSN